MLPSDTLKPPLWCAPRFGARELGVTPVKFVQSRAYRSTIQLLGTAVHILLDNDAGGTGRDGSQGGT